MRMSLATVLQRPSCTSENVQGLAHVQSSQESLVTGHLDGLNDTSESKIPLTACSGPFAADFVHTEPNFQSLKNTHLIQDHIPFSSDIELEPKKSGPILKQNCLKNCHTR